MLVAAEARGVEVLREAQDEARRQLAGVAAERDRAVAEGVAEGEAERDAILAAAREEADALVGEAKAARQKVLADLTRRRKAARVQVEQLHAAHERLLAALTTVRGAIDTTTAGLREALPEAKAAADAAARRVEAEPDVVRRAARGRDRVAAVGRAHLGRHLDVDPDVERRGAHGRRRCRQPIAGRRRCGSSGRCGRRTRSPGCRRRSCSSSMPPTRSRRCASSAPLSSIGDPRRPKPNPTLASATNSSPRSSRSRPSSSPRSSK